MSDTTCADADMPHVMDCPDCQERLARQRLARMAACADTFDALFGTVERPLRGHIKGGRLRAVPVDWKLNRRAVG